MNCLFVCFLLILSQNISFQVKLKISQEKENQNDPFYDVSQTRATMGHHAWIFLHSIAAAYPDEPTDQDKEGLKELFSSIGKIFPCQECKGHFNNMIAENPLVDTNKKEVIYYFCKLHNLVNVRLQKRVFDCDKAFEYWKVEGCGCNGNSSEENEDADSTNTENASESTATAEE